MFEVAVLPVHRKQRDERFLAQQRVRQLVCQLRGVAANAVHLEPELWGGVRRPSVYKDHADTPNRKWQGIRTKRLPGTWASKGATVAAPEL